MRPSDNHDYRRIKLGLESPRRVVTKHQNCPSPAAITRARLALACTGTRERFKLVLHPNLVLQMRNTCILAAWDGMKFNGFSTFLYRLAEFHLVLHFVLRLRKARIPFITLSIRVTRV